MDNKLVLLFHILSVTIMVTSCLGGLYYLYSSYLNKRVKTLIQILRMVIKAELVLTAPAIVFQFLSGWLLSDSMRLTNTDWFLIVLSTSVLMLVLWLGQVKLQMDMLDMIKKEGAITAKFDSMMKVWLAVNILVVFCFLCQYYMMLYKPLTFS